MDASRMIPDKEQDQIVWLYGMSGIYSGSSEIEYRFPEAGPRFNCILWLRQVSNQEEPTTAQSEITRYGFVEVTLDRSGPLQHDELETDLYAKFKAFRDEALENGSCLVIYPNKEPPDGSSQSGA